MEQGAPGAAARQAERLGVQIGVAQGEAEWDQYDEIYRESQQRWGESATSSYGPELFRALREGGGDCVRLWLATVGGELAAGALCLYARRHVSYWHGAARERLFEYRPVHLLIEVILKDACDRGMRWFDFNPSGGHSGVEAFKKGFGAEAFPAPVLRWEMPVLRRSARRASRLRLAAPREKGRDVTMPSSLRASHNWLTHDIFLQGFRDLAARHLRGRLLDVGCATKPWADVVAPFVSRHVGIDTSVASMASVGSMRSAPPTTCRFPTPRSTAR